MFSLAIVHAILATSALLSARLATANAFDQVQADGNADTWTFNGEKRAQSFRPGFAYSGQFSVLLNLRKVGSPSPLNVELWSDSSGVPGAKLEVFSPAVSTSYTWVECRPFTSTVARDSTYWIVIAPSGADDTANHYEWRSYYDGTIDKYPRGSAARYMAGSWTASPEYPKKDYCFKTWAGFTFVHISDMHVTATGNCRGTNDCDDGGATFGSLLTTLKGLSPQPAFVIASGDNVDYGVDNTTNPSGGEDNFTALTNQLEWSASLGAWVIRGTTTPVYFCPGNHDSRQSISRKSGEHVWSQSMCNYSRYINRDTPVDNACDVVGPTGTLEALPRPYNEDGYFDFHVTIGTALIVSMNSGRDTCADLSCLENPEGDGLLNPQMTWLTNTLNTYASYSPKILFMHHPPANIAGKLCDGETSYCGTLLGSADGSIAHNREGTDPATSLMQLCADRGVDLVLAGHVHQSARTDRNGTPLADLPGKVYPHAASDGTWFIQTANAFGGSYRLINVTDTGVTVNGPARAANVSCELPSPSPKYSIQGTTSEGGLLADTILNAIGDVTVDLSSDASPQIVTTSTDTLLGKYAFFGLMPGKYTITPRKTGWTFTPTSQKGEICNGGLIVGFIGTPTPSSSCGRTEAVQAVLEFFRGNLTKNDAIKVVVCYFNSQSTGPRPSPLAGWQANVLREFYLQNGGTVDTTVPYWPGGSVLWAMSSGQTSITLSWTRALDNVGVTAYRVYQDGVLVQTLENVTSTTVTGLTAGTTYTFKVEAADGFENWTGTGPSKTVRCGDAAPPTVAITAPANGAHVNFTPAIVTGTAGDDVVVSKVEVRVNGASGGLWTTAGSACTAPGAAPWSCWGASVALVNGFNTIEARATDGVGNTTSTQATVTLDLGKPMVTITSPPNGFASSTPAMALQGTASDAVGLSNVRVQVNGGAWTTVWTGSGTTASWSANVSLVNGANSIIVMATSQTGSFATASMNAWRGARIAAGGVSYGGGHSLALSNGGDVWAWGLNNWGQLAEPLSVFSSATPLLWPYSNVIDSVAAGGYHSLALCSRNGGFLFGWGFNRWGQLGLGPSSTDAVDSPQFVSESPAYVMYNVVAVAAGYGHSLALRSDGSVWAWGNNQWGQLGNGNTSGAYDQNPWPAKVPNLTNVIAIAAGHGHSVALTAGGEVWRWGANGNGLGTDSSVPVLVSGLSGVVAIAAGENHTLALRGSDGTVWSWGYGTYCELGNGSTADSSVPVQVSNLSGVVTVAGTGFHSLALKGSDGSIWAWGYNAHGELGNGSTTSTSSCTPVQSGTLAGVTAVAGGSGFSLAMTGDGRLWAWGLNYEGELGNGAPTASPDVPTPTPVNTQWFQISITSPADNFLTSSASLTVLGAASDYVPLSSIQVQLNGGSWTTAWTGGATTTSWSANLTLSPGSNTIVAKATDSSGKTRTAQINVTLDPPVIAITSPANNSTTNSALLAVSGTASDDSGLSVTGVQVQVGGGAWQTVWTGSSPSTSWSANVTLAPGTNTIVARAIDQVGDTASTQVAVTLDATPPAVVITSPVSGLRTNSAGLTVAGTTSDNIALASVALQVNDGAWQTVWSGSATSATWSASVTASSGGNRIVARATDSVGNSTTAAVLIQLDTAAPAVAITSPVTNSVTTNAGLTVQGSARDDVELQKVEVQLNGGAWNAVATTGGYWSAAVTLAAGSNTILARATDAAGNTATTSAVVTLCTNPGVPTAPTFTNVATTSLTVSWTDVTNEVGYQVQRCQGTGCTSFANVGSQLAAGTTTFADGGLTAGTVYRYRILAIAATGCTTQNGTSSGDVTTACVNPGVPAAPYFTSWTTTSLTVNWLDVADEAGYQVQRCQGSGCTSFANVGSQLAAGTTTFADTGLTAVTTYRYRIVAVAGTGCTNQTGTPRDVTTPCTNAPTFTNVGSTTLRVNWNSVANATGYYVYRYENGLTFFAVSPQLPASALYFDDSNLVSSYTYSYKVLPLGTTICGTNQPGPSANVTTAAGACTSLPATPGMGYSKPASGATGVSLTPWLEDWGNSWGDVARAASFDVQIATDVLFTGGVRSHNTGCYCNYWQVSPALNSRTTYYWRVRSVNACGASGWSAVYSFTTQ